MDITAVRISNFRSIKDTGWVDVDRDITTLIGKNESGKTAVLESIAELTRSEPVDGSDINDSADTNPFSPIVRGQFTSENGSAQVEVMKLRGGARVLAEEGDLSVFHPFSKELVSCVIYYMFEENVTNIDRDQIQEFQKSHDIPNANRIGRYEKEEIKKLIEGILTDLLDQDFDGEAPIAQRIQTLLEIEIERIEDFGFPISDFIADKLPTVVYMDSTDQLPDEINKSDVGSESQETFNNLIRISGADPDKIESMKPREQAEVVDEISTTIEGDLNNLWDQKTVKVNVREASSKYIPLVRDQAVDGEDVSREPRVPSERSKGFQWFLSFHINTSAAAGQSDKKLFLLDDPAVYLHPEGKKDWLDAIEDLGNDNQVIYTSHSPYLIYKDRPSRIRIVEDRSEVGTTVVDEFHSSNQESLEPLRDALGIGIGSTPFATKRKILVEGPSDKYILRGAIHYLSERGEDILSRKSTSIIPTGGANKMIRAAKWVESEDFAYIILLDKDQKGDKVVQDLKVDAPELKNERIVQLELNDEKKNQHIEIEDMIPAEFYIDCVNTVYENEKEGYTGIDLREEGGQRYINSIEYNDRKIASKVQDAFDSAGYGGLDKLMVAKEIERRFISGRVDEKVLSDFKIVLGKMAERF